MASQDILKKVLEHQLAITQEIKENLKDHLTEELLAAFQDSEEFLQQLQEREEVQRLDIENLQRKWDVLTQAIDHMQRNLSDEIDALQTQEKINRFYNR